MNATRGVTGGSSPALARLPRLSPAVWLVFLAVALLVATLPGLWTLGGLVALAVSVAALVRPEIAVYLLTLTIPLGSLLELEAGKAGVTANEGLVALLVVGWAGRSLARRRLVISNTPLLVPLLAMLLWVGLSVLRAPELSLAIKETLKWLELVLVYLFIVAEMASARQVLTLGAMMLTGSAIEALLGLGQFVLDIGPEFYAIGRFMRAYGTFDQPNPYAGYLGILIPLAIGLVVARAAVPIWRWILAACLLAIGAVLASLSRGAWVGIAAANGVMMVFWSTRSRLILAASVVALAPVGALAFLNVLPAEVASRVATVLDYFRFIDARQETVTPENYAVLERVAHWQAGLDMVAAQPLLGVGAGNYAAVYEKFMVPGWLEPLGHAHNIYINLAAETGVPGLLLYLTILAVALIHTTRWLALSGRLPRESDRRSIWLWRGVLLGVLGALVASSIHNMFDNLFVHGMNVLIGMVLALGQVAAQAVAATTHSEKAGYG